MPIPRKDDRANWSAILSTVTSATPANIKGVLVAALAAAGFSISFISVGFAFRAGADPATMIVFRGLTGLLAGLVMIRLLSDTYKLPANAVTPLVLATLGMTLVNYGYMIAIQYIPISLATLTFYTYPMVVLAITSLAERRLPRPLATIAFVMAFGGLAITLGASLSGLDWRGIASALVATTGGTLLFFYGAVTAKRTSIALYTLYSHVAIILLGIAVMWAFDGPHLPHGTEGNFAIIGMCLGYTVGISAQFLAFRMISPAIAALVFNVEPVITISLSALLLGDVLSLNQYFGGALVISGVVLATRVTNRQ